MGRSPVLAGLLVGASLLTVPSLAEAGTVRDGHARFEVLSPTLIRLEYADDDRFEDGRTMTAANPPCAPVAFQPYTQGAPRFIRTAAMPLRYRRGSGPFTQQNVSIDVRG